MSNRSDKSKGVKGVKEHCIRILCIAELTIYSEIPLLRPPKIKASYLLKTLFAMFKLFFSLFSTPSVPLIRDHLWDCPKVVLKFHFWTVPKVVLMWESYCIYQNCFNVFLKVITSPRSSSPSGPSPPPHTHTTTTTSVAYAQPYLDLCWSQNSYRSFQNTFDKL